MESRYGKLRSPIGEVCNSLVGGPPSINEDGPVRSALQCFCSDVYGIFVSKKEAQPFGVVKSPFSVWMGGLYETLSSLIPKGKTPKEQADEQLARMGWTQDQLDEVRALELLLGR